MSIDSIGGAVQTSMAMNQEALGANVAVSMHKKNSDFLADAVSSLISNSTASLPEGNQVRNEAMQKQGKGQKLNMAV